jgi:hypothetical protein
MLIFAGVFVVTVLVGVGLNYRRRGSWAVLVLTFFGIPVALFVSLWATGIGHPSGKLYLAKLFLPYMVFPFTLRLVTTDDAASLVCFWLPLLQVLLYGVILAGGYYRGRIWPRVAWLVGVHIFAALLAFTFHHGGYLDAK